MSQVPAATRTLRVLTYLGQQPRPVPLHAITRAVGMPRSSAYHLLSCMIEEGFVVSFPQEGTFGLGVGAFEIANGYARQAPLQRLARAPVAALAEATGFWAHMAVLHGRDVLYLLEERAPRRPSLLTDVGVRVPAPLTASGRAMLAELPDAQVRILFPDATAFADRHGTGPGSLSALRRILVDTRARGYAEERGVVTLGLSSIALPVFDHTRRPIAAITVTHDLDETPDQIVHQVRKAADFVSRQLTRGTTRSPPP